ncbi:hypothetical protein AK88_02354 [Plasmodium fragile]|uniref:Uncharacterized protein n=1 Tax=Plasmodium fragile TaxID=5857 RepID=A0A0D9QLH1_PLAFR|nr:uncharacterized protein AK88_02354 [Plasmodium fragile]KJP87920.1 hypothetical protein AK88_02354 [Plasmodium fragile]
MNIQKEAKNGNTGKYDHAKKGNKNNKQECYSTNLIKTDDKVNMLKNNTNENGCSEEIVSEKLKVNINQSVLKEGTTTPIFKNDRDTTEDAKKKGNGEVHYKGSTRDADGSPVKTSTEGVVHDKSKGSVCNHNNVANGADNDYQHGRVAWGCTNNDGRDTTQSSNRELDERTNVETLNKVLPKSEVKKKHYSNLLPNRNCNDDDKCNLSQNVKKVPPSQEEKEKFETSPATCKRKSVGKDPPANDKRGSASKGCNGDNKPVDTSVEAPPFNTPQKGSNNDEKEAQYVKMESRISSKQNNEKTERTTNENGAMGEGAKQGEPMPRDNIKQSKNANIHKNKSVVKDNLDVITKGDGNTERGPKDDHPNDHINSSVKRTPSGSSKKTYPFKRSEHQKDKENRNEETSSNNVMSQKNGNYKKFPTFNNSNNGASFKKELRKKNPNIGSCNRKSENHKNFGHSKREQCWKICRDKNEDCNTTSGDYFKSGENYKREESYSPGDNSPNSSNNSNGRSHEPHRTNERGFKNSNPRTCRNAINGGYKNVCGKAQMDNSAKVDDNFHNAGHYKMSNYKNHYRNGKNEDTTGSSNRYGEKSGSQDQGVYWTNQNEQHERYEQYEPYEQNGKNESLNFRRKNFKNKKESTGVKQQDTRFHATEKYPKKYDANYFERNDSANVGNDSGSANKKKVNSSLKKIQSTNYSKHSPINGDTKGKESNGYDENDSTDVCTEGDASVNSTELVDKQIIHTVNHTSSSSTYHNSGEKTHNHIPRAGKKNSIVMSSPSHQGNINQDNKDYHKHTHTNYGKRNPKRSITAGGNSDHMKSENKCNFIPNADMSDSGRSKLNNSGEKDVMKGIRTKEYKTRDYGTLEGEGHGAHVKKIERRAKHFTAHPGDCTKSHVATNGNEYHHAAGNGNVKDQTNSQQGEKDKNPKNGGKQNHSNGPENKRTMLSQKIDQRSSNADEVTPTFNFNEFECWMSGRYNKLLDTYIDQQNRKKNNSEIFEDEIKVYELCSAYTNSGVEKESHENLSQMTETLGSRDTTEEDGAGSNENANVQTNSDIANERELVIEGKGRFSTRRNKGEHVDHTAGDNYKSGKSNYFPGAKNHMHLLDSSAAHEGENMYYQRNNNYRPKHEKKPLQFLHKNGPQNNKAPFLSSSSKKWDNLGRAGGEEVVENAIEDAKLEGKLEENTDTNAENNANNNTGANVTPSVKKYSAHNKNNKGEEKAGDGNFNRKNYYAKRQSGKGFGSSNITTKKLSSSNGFHKNKYHAGDHKNDYMKNEMNNATFYKSNRHTMGQHNNKRNNWSAKLVNDRFGNRYEEPFREQLNERFSKQNNSNDMDHTSGMFYASKNRIDKHDMLRNEMGTASTHNSNPAGNSRKSN